eukprot:PLAT11117.1.p1 GENE.PLAT11117.1~~PLAT11117.1.p1  ORF type:complete len:654 (+),score=329.48 PLAT11117.1:22-1983(+)
MVAGLPSSVRSRRPSGLLRRMLWVGNLILVLLLFDALQAACTTAAAALLRGAAPGAESSAPPSEEVLLATILQKEEAAAGLPPQDDSVTTLTESDKQRLDKLMRENLGKSLDSFLSGESEQEQGGSNASSDVGGAAQAASSQDDGASLVDMTPPVQQPPAVPEASEKQADDKPATPRQAAAAAAAADAAAAAAAAAAAGAGGDGSGDGSGNGSGQGSGSGKQSAEAVSSYDDGRPRSKFWRRWKERDRKKPVEPAAVELAERPLLEFVMIVKNEAASIVETIESVKDYVDRWTILDTGSTDGTQQLIRDTFQGVPGNLHEEEFVDFSTTRNRALELAGTRCVFNFMLSGDESLHKGQHLRAFLEKRRDWKWVNRSAKHEAYNVRVHYGVDVYDSTRIARTDALWYYVGATHEYMTNRRKNVATIRVADDDIPYIFHDLSGNDPAAKRVRWQLDLQLLQAEWAKNPNYTRTAFYMAQTYECLLDYPNAYKWYKIRFELNGWKEEAYEAKFRMARVGNYMHKPWTDVQQLYLQAHSHLRARAEPLYQIAHHYYKQKDYPLAFLFASSAARIPFPSHLRLFVDRHVYDYKVHDLLGVVCYYVKEYEAGITAIRKAMKIKPKDARLLKNLRYYERALEKREEARAARLAASRVLTTS